MKSFPDSIINFVSSDLVGWINKRYHFGRLRFKIVRFIYKYLPYYPKARNEIWDWVLNYIPSLGMTFFKGLSVLDVGCTDSLLIHELSSRGYAVAGMDIRPYQSRLPPHITFLQQDISDPNLPQKINIKFRYIICISVIELVGTDMYGDMKDLYGDRKALENIHKILDDWGYLLLTLSIDNFRCLKGRGYHVKNLLPLIEGLFQVIELTQRSGHLCVALIKL